MNNYNKVWKYGRNSYRLIVGDCHDDDSSRFSLSDNVNVPKLKRVNIRGSYIRCPFNFNLFIFCIFGRLNRRVVKKKVVFYALHCETCIKKMIITVFFNRGLDSFLKFWFFKSFKLHLVTSLLNVTIWTVHNFWKTAKQKYDHNSCTLLF